MKEFITTQRGRRPAGRPGPGAQLATTATKPAFKDAAGRVGRGWHAVREFLRTQHYEGKYQDDRVKIVQIINTGGSATRSAAERALNGTELDQHEFIRSGQHIARIEDERVEATEYLQEPEEQLTEISAAVQVALAGPPSYVTEFLQVGLFKAAANGQGHGHARGPDGGLHGRRRADRRQRTEERGEAQRVAAIARNAATEADGYARQAQESANQAAEHARQADQSALDAQASAAAAAESARVARRAEASARQSAIQAENSATSAANSAAQASAYAAAARQSADTARQHANNANQSAQDAAKAATSAAQYAADKQAAEDYARRNETPSNPVHGSGLNNVTQYPNGAQLVVMDGVCYINGQSLPSDIGEFSCGGMAAHFDEWLRGTSDELDWDRLRNNPDAMMMLLGTFCHSMWRDCGPTLTDIGWEGDFLPAWKLGGGSPGGGKVFTVFKNIFLVIPRKTPEMDGSLGNSLRDILNKEMQKPIVMDPALARFMNDLWHMNTSAIGNGSTAAAVRIVKLTGGNVGSTVHMDKAHEFSGELRTWLAHQDSLPPAQRASQNDYNSARSTLHDLQEALAGR